MRIIGQIDHPHLKISVFRNENRTSVKFENGASEITYKLGDDERFKTVEQVERLLDPLLMEAVNFQFQQLNTARLAAMNRLYPVESGTEFETII